VGHSPPVLVRLALGALVLLVAIVAILGTWQVMAARDSQRNEIENGEVTAAHLAGSALASALASRLELVSNLAEQPAVSKLFTATNLSQLSELAPTLHLLYPGFASFDVMTAGGRLEGRWPSDPVAIGTNVSTKDFFMGVMRSGRPFVSEAMQQKAPPRELVVGLAAPVRDGSGKIVGILQGTLPALTLGSIIGGTGIRGGGQLVIVDQAGHLLTGPAAGSARSFRSLPLIARGLAGQTGTASGTVPGFSGTRLVGYAPVPSTGWTVIAEDPLATLDSPLAGLTERLAAIGLLVLVLAIGTAILVAILLRRLTREQEEAGALLASVGEGVATIDLSGRPMRVNPALERLTGRGSADLIGHEWHEALAVYDQRGQAVTWEDSIASAAIRQRHVVASTGYDIHLACSDGRRIPIALTAAPLLVGDDLLGAVVVVRDVSHEREVDQLKSSLVSTVSHELRTPLTMIQGFSELLLTRDDLGATRSREALEQVHASAKRLGRLIDDLLSVSRIDSGKLTADLSPVDLAGVVAEVVRTFGDENGCRFVAEIEPGLPAVLADRDKMVQIVTNLASNAVKYSSDRSPVRIVAHSTGNHAEVSVIDHGIGMTDAECSQIFEKFTRSARPEVQKVGGTGLGLYITKSLVELQHGQVWVRSDPGEGSTFSLSLPFAEQPPTQQHNENRQRRSREEAFNS
jgi:PAS domain S-box-containing protein